MARAARVAAAPDFADDEGEERKGICRCRCTPLQTVATVVGINFVIWAGGLSAMMSVLAARYTGEIVDTSRGRYVYAAADRIGTEAVKVFEAAQAARQAVDYAVQRQLYFEPLDYDSLRLALEPAFAAHLSLRAVDVAFDARPDTLTLRRQIGPGASKELLVQSDAADCFEKLGRLGCLAVQPGQEMEWYQIGISLPGGQEADNASSFVTESLENFQWASGPGFVPNMEGAITEGGRAVAWAPAHSLIFRSVFPGTSGKLSVIGRAIVEVTALRDNDRLSDVERLGVSGVAFICDRKGTLLATLDPGKQALIMSPSGITRFRNAWELGSWMNELTADHLARAESEGGLNLKLADWDIQVTIMPLTGRGNSGFFMVVGADRSPFVDSAMELICNSAQTLIITPYPAVGTIVIICVAITQAYRRRKKRKVHPHPAADKAAIKPAEKGLAMLRARTGQGNMSGLAAKIKAQQAKESEEEKSKLALKN